jgi:hypothetical protein
MDSSQLRDLIGQKRPRISSKYYEVKGNKLANLLSNKGQSAGKDNFCSFGPVYETYMYAFIVGYKLAGTPKFLEKGENTEQFNNFVDWKPTAIRDYITMLLLNKSEDFGFKWVELENASAETIDIFVTELIRQMEGYANVGFEYLQNKWDNENMMFRNPFVFVNILEELNS